MPSPDEIVPKGTPNDPIVVKAEPYEKPEIRVSWHAPTRLFKRRNPVWFLAFFLLIALVVAFLLFTKQWTFALAIVAGGLTLFALNTVEPGGQTFTVTSYGIRIGEKLTQYSKLKWFWFSESDGDTVLYVSTYLMMPHIFEMPLPRENSAELKTQIEEELLKHIPYHEEGERDWLNSLDNVIVRIEPWLPASLIQWYTNRFHKA